MATRARVQKENEGERVKEKERLSEGGKARHGVFLGEDEVRN